MFRLTFLHWTALVAAVAFLFYLTESRASDRPLRDDPVRLRRLARRLSMPEWMRWFPCGALFLLGILALLEAESVVIEPLHGAHLSLFALAILSISWAESRALTALRAVQWSMVGFGAFAIAARLSIAQSVALVATCNGLFLTIALVEEVSTRSFRPRRYRFSGTLNAIKQSIHCMFLVLCTAYLLRIGYWDVAIGVPVLMAAVTLLWFTNTRGAIWPVCIAGMVWLLRETVTSVEALWWAVGVVVALGVLAVANRHGRKYFLRALLLGRVDASWRSFSNRTPMWKYALRELRARPVLGFGHGGFWNPRRAAEMGERLGFRKPVYTSCSLYVDVLVNTGAVGLALLGVMLTIAYGTALTAPVRGSAVPESGFLLAVATLLVLHSIFEATFLLPSFRMFSFSLLLFALS